MLSADPATQNGERDGQRSVPTAHRRRAERRGQVAYVNDENLVVLANDRHTVGCEETLLAQSSLFTDGVPSLQRGEVINSGLDRREFLDGQGKGTLRILVRASQEVIYPRRRADVRVDLERLIQILLDLATTDHLRRLGRIVAVGHHEGDCRCRRRRAAVGRRDRRRSSTVRCRRAAAVRRRWRRRSLALR